MRVDLPAVLLSGPQSDRGSPLEGQAPTKEDRGPHQGGADRGDGSSVGGRGCLRCARVLRSLRLLRPGAAIMIGAVRGLFVELRNLRVQLRGSQADSARSSKFSTRPRGGPSVTTVKLSRSAKRAKK